MSTLAVVRPDSWNFPLLLHVLGAMILVGGLLTGASLLAFARGNTNQLRLGYKTLLLIGLPGFILMRVGAQWIYSKEGWDDLEEEPAWLGIGWITADAGGLLFLISLIVGGIGTYRLRNGNGSGLLKATLILALLLLAVFTFAAWAMSGKPD